MGVRVAFRRNWTGFVWPATLLTASPFANLRALPRPPHLLPTCVPNTYEHTPCTYPPTHDTRPFLVLSHTPAQHPHIGMLGVSRTRFCQKRPWRQLGCLFVQQRISRILHRTEEALRRWR